VSAGLAIIYACIYFLVYSHRFPELYGQNLQILSGIIIGTALFSGVIRYELPYIVNASLILLYMGEFILNGFNPINIYGYLTIMFLMFSIYFFNDIYLTARVNEFKAIMQKNKIIEELTQEIDARKKLQYRLKEMATYDGLTSSYTRSVGLNILSKDMEKSDQEFKSLAICFIDINNLKDINDIYGHKIGDVYIITLVNILNQYKRPSDYCIRLGGDEFLLVMPDTSFYEAERLWTDIRLVIHQYKVVETQIDMPLVVSHGVAEYVDGNYSTLEHFLDEADNRMYKEKRRIKEREKRIFA
jgi:diguanylate cyclase (GGDEF)-like protein